MTSYFVTWAIDVFDAESPQDAAQQAFDIVTRPGSTATVFNVIEHDSDGESVTVDLQEESDQ